MANVIPPPPIQAAAGEFVWTDWYSTLVTYLNTANSIPWTVVNKSGSSLSDITNRNHVMLTAVQGGNATEQYHLTAAQYAALGAASVTSFNTRTGAVTLTSADVKTALGSPLTATGSRAGNVALASLLTQLATLGLITDSTTP